MRETFDSQSVKAALITPSTPWQMVDFYASIDSTNLEALRHPLPGRVVVADFQSAGRGRLARQWQAPARASIAVSAVLPMPADRSADWGWLPLLTGMAMREALEDVAHVVSRLKWPNDVLVQEGGAWKEGPDAAGKEAERTNVGRTDVASTDFGSTDFGSTDDSTAAWLKISGVLCEMVPEGGLVVMGVGANIDQERSELPVETATSLALCGAGNVRREDVVVRYLRALAGLHRTWSGGGAGLEALRAAYRSSCVTVGLDVDVHQPDGRVCRGTATGVDDTGRLTVQADGSRTAHAAGDVVHVRRSRA